MNLRKQKLLLMGKAGAGKTSMRSIIFANYVPRDTERLGPTLDVEQSHIRFVGDLALNLWDCGGQDDLMDNFLDAQRENVFTSVEVLLYVFDVESRENAKDMEYFRLCVESLAHKSPGARVFCLIHKMDLVPEEKREAVFSERNTAITAVSKSLPVECFPTSIWNESLYKAWSSVVCSLIPNLGTLESRLRRFCDVSEADEVVLFERATFLVIAHAALRPHADVHRFEKISNIIKQFKLCCNKSRTQLESMEIHQSGLTAVVDAFTKYTCVMVVTSDEAVNPAVTWINIGKAKNSFDQALEGDGAVGAETSL